MQSPSTVLPLQGWRAGVSAAPDVDTMAQLLEGAGAMVSRFEQGPRPSERPVEGWLSELISGEVTDVILFSAQGVRMLYELARQLGREGAAVQALRQVRIVAQGGRTERALAELGLRSAVRARARTEASLLEALSTLDLNGRVVALQPRDPAADAALIAHLTSAGAKVRTRGRAQPVDDAAKGFVEKLIAGAFDGLVFFDANEVRWLWDAAMAEGHTGALREALAAVAIVGGEPAVVALRDRGVRARSAPHGVLDGSERLEDFLPLLRTVPAAE
ncbi:MAG TPA: uroporphyrinogen-III synthase [Polyangiaceae bacterium]|jgi:uroporphyrinogen-III synthase|nr:uroporphyrinogen-III synthase [Polyangiaceae bacterium]